MNSENTQKTNDRRPPRRMSGRRRSFAPVKSEFKEKTIDMRRVSRVVKGGKRFSFRSTIVLGDEKGRVGIGTAKGLDVAQAVEKAKNEAKKNMVKIPLKGTTLAHEVLAKYSAARVLIRPAEKGSGLKAGGSVRTVLMLAGVQDASAKCLGKTKNKLTNALATLTALKKLNV